MPARNPMSLREYPDVVQNTDEWLAVKRGLVSASVIGPIQ